ncbi:unnamed protein product [Spirodela intermedia]|uniref:Uncharacterized protein n=1 Tax=Spirodela intermedia TaxID=51605 RepID=A0ABN7ECP4_SPIIN|nr:unnamed protein product [Spirodela intermedia]
MKFTMINPSIKLLVIALEGQERRDLKNLHNTIDVHPVDVHSLHSQPQETGQGDVCQWLDNVGLNALKHPCDDN